MTETHLEKRLVGYARVSTYGQTLDTQLEQLRAAGCSSRNIYREKVTRIDRLARSTFDLFGIVKHIVDAKAQFRSLAEPWADTGTSTGRLMLAVLGGTCRCGARSYPHPHRREQKPRQGPRKAHWEAPCPNRPNKKRQPDGARGALRCKNWRAATM
jgi:hypothetical protein